MTAFLQFALVILFWGITVVSSIRGADFDIYPLRDSSNDNGAENSFVKVMKRIGNSVSMGGGIYFGLQLAKFANRIAQRKNSSEYGEDLALNTTALEDIQKDQLELWRIVHKIYTSQSELVSNSTIVSTDSLNTQLFQLQSNLNASLENISTRILALENQLVSISANVADKNMTEIAIDGLKLKLETEITTMTNLIRTLETDIPNIVREHDEAMLKKLRDYSEDIKKTLKALNSKGIGRKN